jgi:hypothetical protein
MKQDVLANKNFEAARERDAAEARWVGIDLNCFSTRSQLEAHRDTLPQSHRARYALNF